MRQRDEVVGLPETGAEAVQNMICVAMINTPVTAREEVTLRVTISKPVVGGGRGESG